MALPLKGTTKGYLGLTGPEEEMPPGRRPRRLPLPPAAFLGNRGHRHHTNKIGDQFFAGHT